MPATGPGDKPNRPRRARKPRPAPPRPASQNAQTYVSQGRAVAHVARQQQRSQRQARQAQHATQNARPLARTPRAPKPKQVVRPLSQKRPQRVTTAQPSRQDIHTDVPTAQRQSAVHVYDQLSHRQKKARVAQAQRRFVKGTAGVNDKAILHIHATRVAGNRKNARGQRAINALFPKPDRVAFPKKNETTREGTARLATAIIRPSSVAGAIKAIGAASAYGLKSAHVPKVVQNVPKDLAELAVTTPTSVAKLGSDVVHHPQRVPGELAAPYVELAKHPKKFATEHPASTLLMVAPAVRAPGRAVGKGLRLAGKQTLERPAATLPATTLKETSTGSRGAVTRAVQARRDVKRGAPQMTQAQMQRRVDEAYDFSKQHVQRATRAGVREAKQKNFVGEEAQQHVEFVRSGARNHQVKRKFAQEFGAPHVRTSDGRIGVPHDAETGAIHANRDAAQAVADHLNAQEIKIRRGAHGVHQTARRNTQVDLKFKVVDAGFGGHAVVPEAAAERLTKHKAVGTSPAPGARYMRTAGRSFRSAVLPLSARWLVGQVGEAGFRSAVAGAGPADLFRLRRVVKEMDRQRKGAGQEFLARIHGGQFDLTGTAREFATDKRTLADELTGTAMEDVAHGVTRVAQALPLRKVRAGWNQYTNVVFNVINGSIENTARKAMAGQAIRQGPLMQEHVIGLSDRAIQDAARGLRGTDAQVQTARAVDRMYGQYQKFSPEKREHLLHTTPFYPWYRNVVTFVTQTLPVDHPLKAALIADLDAATEDWRKAHGLSLRRGGHKPGFLLGTYPVGKKGQTVPAGRYLPFVPGEPLQAVGDLFLPQYANVQDILKGKDWKGQDIKGGAKGISKELAKSIVEAHVPGAGQVDQILSNPEGAKKGAVRLVNPLPKTRVRPKRKRTRRSRKRKQQPTANPLLKSSVTGGNPLLKH